jgi:hypothetical protein
MPRSNWVVVTSANPPAHPWPISVHRATSVDVVKLSAYVQYATEIILQNLTFNIERLSRIHGPGFDCWQPNTKLYSEEPRE